MKTIEERAKAFCEKNICVDCGDRKDCDRKCLGTCIPTYDAFEWLIQFGKSEHAELTRWHDIETDKDGFATSESLNVIFDRLPRLVKDNRSGEIELIGYDNAPEWRGDIERIPSRYRWREIYE